MAVSYVGMAVWYCLSTWRLQDGLSALLSEMSQVIQPKEAVWDESGAAGQHAMLVPQVVLTLAQSRTVIWCSCRPCLHWRTAAAPL